MNILSAQKKPILYLISAPLALACSDAWTQEVPDDTTVLELRAGYGRSDNVLRRDANEIDSDIFTYGVRVDWSVDRPRYALSITGDVDRLNYSDDAAEDRFNGDLDGRLDVKLVDERLVWWVAESFSQLRRDIELGDTPDNLREFNVVGTGLEANLSLSARTSLGAQASFNKRSFDDLPDLDSDETAFNLGFFRQVSARSRVGLQAGRASIAYDAVGGAEYDIDSGRLSYESTLATGAVSIGIGANRISDFVQGDDGDWRVLFDLSWNREVGTRSRLAIDASHRLADIGSSFEPGEGAAPGSSRAGQLIGTQSPFEATDIAVSLTTDRDDSAFAVGVSFTQQEFLDTAIPDNDVVGLDFSWLRDLSAVTTFGFDAFAGRRKDSTTNFEGRDYRVGLVLARDFSERFRVALRYQRSGRDADNDSDYTENLARIDFTLILAR